MTYLLIFSAKTIENILTTIRIILLSNHKKLIASLLNFFIMLIWIYSTISILDNFMKEPISILAYALGCGVGSYLGCFIEEKIALGNNMITCITESKSILTKKLRELEYQVTTLDGFGINDAKKILLIMIPRKKKFKLAHLIKRIDKDAIIVMENASYFNK